MGELALADLNLWQRLHLAQSAARGIAKHGTAPASMGGFHFVTDADVADAARELFGEFGICHVVQIAECVTSQAGATSTSKPVYRADVRVQVKLINIDKPQETETVEWWGRGDDTQDKSIGKAGTSAVKNALIKLLNLQGDPSADPDSVDPTAGEGRVQAAAPPPTPPEDQVRIDYLRDEVKRMLADIPTDGQPTAGEKRRALAAGGPQALYDMVKSRWEAWRAAEDAALRGEPGELPLRPGDEAQPIMVSCPRCSVKVPTGELAEHLGIEHEGEK